MRDPARWWNAVPRPARWWILLFLAVNVAFPIRPSTNPLSRYALLCALVEDGSFRIDPYVGETIDWSRTPDGHYYSNKAPGPALAALPLFFAFDRLSVGSLPTRAARDEARWHRHRMRAMSLLSFFVQAVPLAILVALAAAALAASGAPAAGIHFFALAALFGNTASLFTNTFFGHAFAAACALAMAIALLKRSPGWVGFFFGWTLLSDYGAAVLLPFVLFVVAPRQWAKLAVGGLVPGALWIVYHVACFGSPFALPQKFQNPVFVDTAAPLWGVIGGIPDPRIVVALVFGTTRGLLWTQPWVLALCLATPSAARKRPDVATLAAVFLPALALLIWMNAAFGGWHGGDTPGPRYLSLVFPALALLAGLSYSALGPISVRASWVGLAVAVALYLVFMAAPVLAPPTLPLWSFYLPLVTKTASLARLAALGILALLAAIAALRAPRRHPS